MDQLSFGLPTTGSEIHFTWSNGVIALSDKFTGDIRLADGDCIRIEDGKWVYRISYDPVEYARAEPGSPVWESQRRKSSKLMDGSAVVDEQLSHPCCPSCGVDEGDVCDPSCDARKARVAMYVAEKSSMEENVRLPHPCAQNVVAGEDIGVGQFVQMKGEGPLRAAYRCFSIAQDMQEVLHEHFLRNAPEKKQVSCKCVSLLHGHEPGCPMEGK